MIEFRSNGTPKIAVLLNDEVEITFKTTKGALRELEAIKEADLIVSVKEYRKRRSLSQNAYLWTLLDQIGAKTNQSKENVYKAYIEDYGVFEILPIKKEAVNAFKTRWEKNGLGYFVEDLGESKLNGFTKLIAYYGTSTYTTEEMKRVIEAVLFDCKELGISTMPIKDIMLLKNEND